MTAAVPGLTDRVMREVAQLDLASYRAIATTPTPTVDDLLRRLSHSANHSGLWLGIAAGLAARPGASRRAAFRGVRAIGVASAAANLLGKQLARRDRPDRLAAGVPRHRHVSMPASSSFPSGHAASAVAFAAGVSAELPWLALPINLLAGTVAYSRVHTGVHYPLDVVAGCVLGAASATAADALVAMLTRPRHPDVAEADTAPAGQRGGKRLTSAAWHARRSESCDDAADAVERGGSRAPRRRPRRPAGRTGTHRSPR